ncbi:MAG: tetratricopeptide repeat protein [Planctomycetes bacterium]|nr:tetratricopeptide repeat protein [Planctomycetota bacterium]
MTKTPEDGCRQTRAGATPARRSASLTWGQLPPRRGRPAARLDLRQDTTRWLGGLFASEPELISAFLEHGEGTSSGDASTVMAAAWDAIRGHPDYADLHYFAAQAAMRAGRPEQAAVLLEHTLEINPDYLDALILSARVAIALGEPGRAIARLEQALALGADYPDVHQMLGDLLRARGDVDRARKAYERALQLNGNLGAVRAALIGLTSEGPGAD